LVEISAAVGNVNGDGGCFCIDVGVLTSGFEKITIMLQVGVYSSISEVKVGVFTTRLSMLAPILLG